MKYIVAAVAPLVLVSYLMGSEKPPTDEIMNAEKAPDKTHFAEGTDLCA